jgi:pilus assembly protein Flp/PilA
MRRIIDAKRQDDGASALEYGLLVAAIAALIVIVVFAFGGLVKNVFQDTCTQIQDKAKPTVSSTTC